jgi:hypothetical protein
VLGLAENGKCVAAHAPDGQVLAQARLEVGGHAKQQQIAEMVAERVVGFGEMIDIDQGQRGVDCARTSQRLVENSFRRVRLESLVRGS